MGRYSNKFVLCILVNGQVQKDLANGEVHIPFGSEYTVRLINKNDRRAVVDLLIDGENMGSFVVNAHDRLDVKRSAHKDAAFRFVDLESPEAYGEGKQGPNPDKTKGLIEARFRLEKENPKVEHIHHYHPYPVPYYPPVVITTPGYPTPTDPWKPRRDGIRYRTTCDSKRAGFESLSTTECSVSNSVNSCLPGGNLTTIATAPCPDVSSVFACTTPGAVSYAAPAAPPLQEGCTVEGGRTGQRWVDVNIDTEDTETVLTLFLKGYTSHSTYGGHSLPPTMVSGMPPAESVVESPGRLNCGASLGFCTSCGQPRQDKMHNFCGNCGNKF